MTIHFRVASIDVTLAGGETIEINEARDLRAEQIEAFVGGLLPESRRLRFFHATAIETAVEELLHEATDTSGLSIVAQTMDGRIIAHAAMMRIDPNRAEVAFAVTEIYQGRGLATIMLGRLAEIASENGIEIFEAVVMPENRAMLDVFTNAGFPTDVHHEGGTIRITLPTAFSDETIARFEERERRATVASLEPIFHPQSIAIVGVSEHADNIGSSILRNLVGFGYTGRIALVHPRATMIGELRAYPRVSAIPGTVDLAIVAVPASAVSDTARDCAAKNVRGLVVISSGFAEIGSDEAKARQHELLAIARDAGMRLVGPNCLGIITTDPAVRMHATFGPQRPVAGRLAFLSQSGALGLAIVDFAKELGLGLSSFVSTGNQADVSSNDLLQYWESDPQTSVILLYLESFGNARKFARIARRVGAKKPIVAIKGGRTGAGARAAGSHTGALVATSPARIDALYERAGIIGTDTLEELFDVAAIVVSQPLPRGNRVAIVTNAGGPAILCADACATHGLEVSVLQEATTVRLREVLGPNAGLSNPIDMTAMASADAYRVVLSIVAADANVDAIIAVYVPPFVAGAGDAVRAIAEAGVDSIKPIVAAYLSASARPRFNDLPQHTPFLTFAEDAALALSKIVRARNRGEHESARMPNAIDVKAASAIVASAASVRPRFNDLPQHTPFLTFAEDAALALSKIVRARNRGEHESARMPNAIDVKAASAIVASALDVGTGWLSPASVAALLDAFSVPRMAQQIVSSVDDVARAAREIGVPVALKAIAPTLLHKSEHGAVRLDIADPQAAAVLALEMRDRLERDGHALTGFVVERMAPKGIEMFVGAMRDTALGPLVACGAGGTTIEIENDVALRLAGLEVGDTREMISELRCAPLLRGYRGAPPKNIAAFEDIVARIDRLVSRFPSIAEIDCNPVVVDERGAWTVDARIRVESAPIPSLLGR